LIEGILGRIFRVIQLRPMTFREIIDEPNSIKQSLLIIILISSAESFGRIIGDMHSFSVIIPVTASIFIQWFLITIGYYIIGNFLYRNQIKFIPSLSIIGFCHAPWLLTLTFALVGLSFSVYLILVMSLIWVLLTLMMCCKVLIGASFMSSFGVASILIVFGYVVRYYVIAPIY